MTAGSLCIYLACCGPLSFSCSSSHSSSSSCLSLPPHQWGMRCSSSETATAIHGHSDQTLNHLICWAIPPLLLSWTQIPSMAVTSESSSSSALSTPCSSGDGHGIETSHGVSSCHQTSLSELLLTCCSPSPSAIPTQHNSPWRAVHEMTLDGPYPNCCRQMISLMCRPARREPFSQLHPSGGNRLLSFDPSGYPDRL